MTKVPPHKKVELGLALAPEGRRLFPEMTVEENLLMGPSRRGPGIRCTTPWNLCMRSFRG